MPPKRPQREEQHDQPALHVVDARATCPTVLDAERALRDRAGREDGVHVSNQQDRAVPGLAPDDVGADRRLGHESRLEPERAQLGLQQTADRVDPSLVVGAGVQVDELLQQGKLVGQRLVEVGEQRRARHGAL
jgi:hypothetical protein